MEEEYIRHALRVSMCVALRRWFDDIEDTSSIPLKVKLAYEERERAIRLIKSDG